jgi:hypothetical protein
MSGFYEQIAATLIGAVAALAGTLVVESRKEKIAQLGELELLLCELEVIQTTAEVMERAVVELDTSPHDEMLWITVEADRFSHFMSGAISDRKWLPALNSRQDRRTILGVQTQGSEILKAIATHKQNTPAQWAKHPEQVRVGFMRALRTALTEFSSTVQQSIALVQAAIDARDAV